MLVRTMGAKVVLLQFVDSLLQYIRYDIGDSEQLMKHESRCYT
jgi:hypothetical protein